MNEDDAGKRWCPFARVGVWMDGGASGGNETRPKNAYVNFIIKY